MTDQTTEAGRVLVARLRERCDNLGGCELNGADHEDVERALPFIEHEAAAPHKADADRLAEALQAEALQSDDDGYCRECKRMVYVLQYEANEPSGILHADDCKTGKALRQHEAPPDD